MTPRHRGRLGGLVGIALLAMLLGAPGAWGSPVDAKRSEATHLEQQLQAQGDRISVIDEQYDEALLKVQTTTSDLATARADLAAANQRYQAVRGQLADQAVAAYMTGGSASMVNQIVRSDGTDLVVRRHYLEAAAASERAVLDALKAVREDLTAQRARLEAAQQAARAAAAQVGATRRAAQGALAAQQATLARVQGELATLVAQEQAARAEREAQAARLAAQRASRSRSSGAGLANPPASHGAAAAVAEAERQIGKPYQYGGSGPNSFDCSGLTAWAWRAGGVSLPHSAAAQYDAITHVSVNALQPGDLVFYGSPIHHVGIYVGGGTMVEASHTGTPVRYASIWRSDLVGAGRPG